MALEKINEKEAAKKEAKLAILSIFNQPRITTEKDELLDSVLELLYLEGNKSGFLEKIESIKNSL